MSIASITRWHCQKVLPLTYDDSLSYYEQLCKLVYKINEVIDTFNEYEEIILELQEGLSELNSIKTKVENLITTVETQGNSITALQTRDRQMQSEIDALTNTVNNLVLSYDNIIAYIDNAVASVKIENSSGWIRLENELNSEIRRVELLIEELAKRVDEIDTSVFNRVKGIRESLEDNNWDIYEDLRYGGLTNAERSEYGGTNEHLMSLVHNNRDLALHGKERLKLHYLFSPVSGTKVSHANAISQLFGFLTNGLTNEQFANLDMTNDEVVALDLTNIEKFLYYSGDTGISVTEYENLFTNNVARLVSIKGD